MSYRIRTCPNCGDDFDGEPPAIFCARCEPYVGDHRKQSISWGLRNAVIERDGHICGICSGPVRWTDVHIDHIKPELYGGETTMDNLQVTHSSCNKSKGARPQEVFA